MDVSTQQNEPPGIVFSEELEKPGLGHRKMRPALEQRRRRKNLHRGHDDREGGNAAIAAISAGECFLAHFLVKRELLLEPPPLRLTKHVPPVRGGKARQGGEPAGGGGKERGKAPQHGNAAAPGPRRRDYVRLPERPRVEHDQPDPPRSRTQVNSTVEPPPSPPRRVSGLAQKVQEVRLPRRDAWDLEPAVIHPQVVVVPHPVHDAELRVSRTDQVCIALDLPLLRKRLDKGGLRMVFGVDSVAGPEPDLRIGSLYSLPGQRLLRNLCLLVTTAESECL
mmetsp:Transcript_62918/g.142039  ORF Transcript_62918/g.142039 Transcript_62918/m.142039 type:complete len:279 (+) Transcript_62918:564-1400(+)